jgi:hypothetical protein
MHNPSTAMATPRRETWRAESRHAHTDVYADLWARNERRTRMAQLRAGGQDAAGSAPASSPTPMSASGQAPAEPRTPPPARSKPRPRRRVAEPER